MKEIILNWVRRLITVYILDEHVWVKTLELYDCPIEQKDLNSGRHRWRINKTDKWKNGKHPIRETNALLNKTI